MVFLIDPSNLKGKQCPKYTCDVVCTLCTTLCGRKIIPMYGVPDPEEQ